MINMETNGHKYTANVQILQYSHKHKATHRSHNGTSVTCETCLHSVTGTKCTWAQVWNAVHYWEKLTSSIITQMVEHWEEYFGTFLWTIYCVYFQQDKASAQTTKIQTVFNEWTTGRGQWPYTEVCGFCTSGNLKQEFKEMNQNIYMS